MDCSFIIPAYNEEYFIAQTIKAIKSGIPENLHPSEIEIVVVDNKSTDQTSFVAKNAGANVIFESNRKISRARNAGADKATGQFLFFIDADTLIPPETLQIAYQALVSGEAYGGGASIQFDDHQGKVFLGIWIPAFWNWISRTFGLAAGSFIFCRREEFLQTGGFPESLYAGEEIGFVQRLKKLKRTSKSKFLVIKNPPVITSSRKLKWHTSGQIVLHMILLFSFPFAVRFKKLCGFWYKRPHT